MSRHRRSRFYTRVASRADPEARRLPFHARDRILTPFVSPLQARVKYGRRHARSASREQRNRLSAFPASPSASSNAVHLFILLIAIKSLF